VALYPLVPDREGVFKRVAGRFRDRRPAVELVDVNLSDNYYDSDAKNSIMQTDADVLEIDSVFLEDIVAAQRIQPLPASVRVDVKDFSAVVRDVGLRGSDRLGLPHWLCSNFLYTTEALAPNLKTWSGTKQTLGASVSSGQGLLIDLMGKSTLGELYFDATFDALNDLVKVRVAAADPTKRFEQAFQAIADAQSLCGADFCRVKSYHNEVGAYARLFARRKGAAFVGYSEELYFFLDETRNQCGAASCVPEKDLSILPFAFSEKGDHPFAWVDSLAIAATCEGDCLEDATAFLAMMNEDSTLTAILLPGGKQPPLYLLPARVTANAVLDSAAPLYPKLRSVVEGAVAVRGPQLGRQLRAMGKAIDQDPKMRTAKP
jgi:thiamine pyridinylase